MPSATLLFPRFEALAVELSTVEKMTEPELIRLALPDLWAKIKDLECEFESLRPGTLPLDNTEAWVRSALYNLMYRLCENIVKLERRVQARTCSPIDQIAQATTVEEFEQALEAYAQSTPGYVPADRALIETKVKELGSRAFDSLLSSALNWISGRCAC